MDTTEKHIETLTKKIMKEVPLESPSLNFTANVMSQLRPKTVSIPYKPLISKKVWFLVAACIAVLVFFSINNSVSDSKWIGMLLAKDQLNFSLNSFVPQIKVSKTFIYSSVFLAFFILAQIPYFKYNNKFNY